MTEHIPPYPSVPNVELAKDQAGNVAKEAGRQATDLLEQTRAELSEQAGRQQQRIADGLRSLADELHAMTQHDGRPGVATDIARQGAEKSKDLASWLADREPGSLVREVKTFARQRPGTFLLLSVGIGFAVGRLTRGLKDASSDDGGTSAAASQAPSAVLAEEPSAILVDEMELVQPYSSMHQEPYASIQEDRPSRFPSSGGAL